MEIKKYKILLLENYSNASLFNHRWLFQLITLFAISALIATLKNAFMFMHLETIYFYTYLITGFVALGFICWMVLKALHNPELFRGINSNLQLVKSMVSKDLIDDHTPGANDPEEIEALKKFMELEEPYLNPSLTIYGLAKDMNIPTRDLSLLINHNLDQHFFDFVNGYRIRKAMDILQKPDKSDLTILEILYEVGFNSKSSFNTAFKKYTKLTPTQYRESASKKMAS